MQTRLKERAVDLAEYLFPASGPRVLDYGEIIKLLHPAVNKRLMGIGGATRRPVSTK